MVKYTIDALNVVLQPLQPIHGCPTFGGLWQFNRQLAECLLNLKHPQHTMYGWAGYIMQERVYTLLTQTPWTDLKMWECFSKCRPMRSPIWIRNRANANGLLKEMRDTLLNVETCLCTLFEQCIDKNFHSSTLGGMGQHGFGNDQPDFRWKTNQQRTWGRTKTSPQPNGTQWSHRSHTKGHRRRPDVFVSASWWRQRDVRDSTN